MGNSSTLCDQCGYLAIDDPSTTSKEPVWSFRFWRRGTGSSCLPWGHSHPTSDQKFDTHHLKLMIPSGKLTWKLEINSFSNQVYQLSMVDFHGFPTSRLIYQREIIAPKNMLITKHWHSTFSTALADVDRVWQTEGTDCADHCVQGLCGTCKGHHSSVETHTIHRCWQLHSGVIDI